VSTLKSSLEKSTKATEWLVYRLGGPRATLLGIVTAPNRETALAKAYYGFNVTTAPARKRIIVLPSSMG
jgi:hypothetical protein